MAIACRTVVVNATGLRPERDGRSVTKLLEEIYRTKADMSIIVYATSDCQDQFKDILSGDSVRWVSNLMHFPVLGIAARILYANILALRHRGSLLIAASLPEASLISRDQVITLDGTELDHRFLLFFYRKALKTARSIITQSTFSKNRLIRLLKVETRKVHVIPQGVQSWPFVLPILADAREPGFILCNPGKSIDALLDSFRHIAVPHKLVVLGVSRRERKKVDLSLSHRVLFQDEISEIDRVRLLQTASVLVSLTETEDRHHLVLEAMASGCPVIVSNVEFFHELCGESAVYVNPRNGGEIAHALASLLCESPLRQTLVSGGLSRTRTRTWTISARKHIDLLTNILDQNLPVARTGENIRRRQRQ